MALSDTKASNAKPKDKPYKLADGLGLFLLVTPTGSKLWRLRYRFLGKERGPYLAVGLVNPVQKLRFLPAPEELLGFPETKCKFARSIGSARLNPACFVERPSLAFAKRVVVIIFV